MANVTCNASREGLAVPFSRDSALFLLLILITAGVNVLIIAAMIADKKTNRSVRVIIVNLLLAGVVLSIAIVIFDVYVIVEGFNYDRAWWDAVKVILVLGGTSRVLFATMYAVTIFLALKFWSKPIIAPESTKYFVITAVIVWIVSFLSALPLAFDVVNDTYDNSCSCYVYGTAHIVAHSVIFSIIPVVVSFVVLMVTFCHQRYNTEIDEDSSKVLKGLLKLGFFLLVVQAINVASNVILPIMYINLVNEFFDGTYFSFSTVFDGAHLTVIPTPVLILIFFKPVRLTLTRWLTCSCTCSLLRQRWVTSSTSLKVVDTSHSRVFMNGT